MHSRNKDFNDESFWPEILVYALDVALGVWTSLPAVGRTMSLTEVKQRTQGALGAMNLGCVSRQVSAETPGIHRSVSGSAHGFTNIM